MPAMHIRFYLVNLAVDRSACDCVHNLYSQHDTAAIQVFRQHSCWGAGCNEHCAGIQILDLQAFVPKDLQHGNNVGELAGSIVYGVVALFTFKCDLVLDQTFDWPLLLMLVDSFHES